MVTNKHFFGGGGKGGYFFLKSEIFIQNYVRVHKSEAYYWVRMYRGQNRTSDIFMNLVVK